MKKLILMAAALAACTFPSLASAAEKKVEEILDLSGFTRIDVAGVFELDVTVGEDYAVALSGPENEMARVVASVKNDTLILDTRDRRRDEKRNRNRKGVKATISMPALYVLDVSGVVDAEARGIDAETFKIDLSGVGELTIAGSCSQLDADVSGVGELDAEDLQCRDVEVDVSGVGEASIYATESADAEVSGIGEINIYGSPKSITKKNGLFSDITVH